jgi:hypothetical protein
MHGAMCAHILLAQVVNRTGRNGQRNRNSQHARKHRTVKHRTSLRGLAPAHGYK